MVDIEQFLFSLGLKPAHLGFKYLYELLSAAASGNIFPLSENGYKMIAEKYSVSVFSVEKSIQYSIETAFTDAKSDKLYKLFGETIDEGKGKPTNKHFIFAIMEALKKT